MKNFVIVLLLIIAGAAVYFGIVQDRKARSYQKTAIKTIISGKLESQAKIRASQARMDSLQEVAVAAEALLEEYLETANREGNLQEINQRYEEDLNLLHSLNRDELHEFIEAIRTE